jgi:hypothetical protein
MGMSSVPSMRAHCWLLLTLTLGGCETEGEASAPGQPAVAATIELGTGLTAWQTLAEGDPLELVAGFQGGWHVDVSVRGQGLEPSELWLRYEAREPQSDASLSFVTHSLLSNNNVLATDEGWLRLGDRVVFDIAGPELVVGSAVCLVVVASSPSWESEDRRCVTIVDELPGP